MIHTFDEIVAPVDKNILIRTRDSLDRLVERAFNIEEDVEKEFGRTATALEASNLMVYNRWGKWKNSNIGASRPPKDDFETYLLESLIQTGLCDVPKEKASENVSLNPGLNNSYISTSIMVSANSAFSVDLPSFNIRYNVVSLACKLPGIGINPKFNYFTDKLVNYEGVGENFRDNVARALVYSYLGEVYQNQLESAQLQELRGNAFGLVKLDEHLNKYGVTGLKKMKLSSLFQSYSNDALNLPEILLEHNYLSDFFEKINSIERSNPIGRASQDLVKKMVDLVDDYPLLGKIPLVRSLGKHLSSTARVGAYNDL